MERSLEWYQEVLGFTVGGPWPPNNPNYAHFEHEGGAVLHAIFVDPFIDGNGRTSRILLNLELMKDGYPPIVIKVENRLDYYKALDKAHTQKDYDDFIGLVAKEVEDSLILYLSALHTN